MRLQSLLAASILSFSFLMANAEQIFFAQEAQVGTGKITVFEEQTDHLVSLLPLTTEIGTIQFNFPIEGAKKENVENLSESAINSLPFAPYEFYWVEGVTAERIYQRMLRFHLDAYWYFAGSRYHAERKQFSGTYVIVFPGITCAHQLFAQTEKLERSSAYICGFYRSGSITMGPIEHPRLGNIDRRSGGARSGARVGNGPK